MARVSSAKVTKRKHKKILNRAKGFYGARSKNYKTARQAVRHAMAHSTRDRKQRQRRMRRLWVIRINAAVRNLGLTYSTFIHALHKAKIEIDRKVLSELAIHDEKSFKAIVDKVKKSA